MHKAIALTLFSLAVVSFTLGFLLAGVAFIVGGAFAYFLGGIVEGEA